MSAIRLRDLLEALERAAPAAWAEPWDRVGLLLGHPDAELRRIVVTLDPSREALRRARDAGADVLLTHHPAWLEAPSRLAPGDGPGGIALEAARAGVALVCAHTNLDRAPAGADALPRALGLTPARPLESSRQEVSLVITYAPREALDGVAGAMSSAGAGRIGLYECCLFASEGEGRFTPLEDASPAVGKPGRTEHADEVRLETVCSPGAVPAVLAAARSAHPYEEPVLLVTRAALDRGAARLGRLCFLEEPLSLGGLAALVARRLGATPRVWGDADARVGTVASAGGSGASLIAEARSAGAEVLVTGEVRYHDATDALESGLAVIEAGHDVTEWPLAEVLSGIARGVSGLPDDAVVVERPYPRWWTPREV